MEKSETTLPGGPITCLVSYPTPPKLTLWEWLGVKPRPPLIPQRLYAVVGSTIFMSDDKGVFDYSLKEMAHD